MVGIDSLMALSVCIHNELNPKTCFHDAISRWCAKCSLLENNDELMLMDS